MAPSIQEQDPVKDQDQHRQQGQHVHDAGQSTQKDDLVLTGQIVQARKCYKRLFFIDLRISSSQKYTILFRSDDCRQPDQLPLPLQLTDQELFARWKRIRRGDTIELKVFDASEDEIAKRDHRVYQAVDFKILKAWPPDDAFPVEPALGLKTSSNPGVVKTDQVSVPSSTDQEQKSMASSKEGEEVAQGDLEQAGNTWRNYCKFWINSQKCLLGQACKSIHPQGDELAQIRKIWVKERVQARKERARSILSSHNGILTPNHDRDHDHESGDIDPHSISAKESHSKRAFIFARWLVETFGAEFLNSGYGVLDVAGGKGQISLFLTHMYGIRSTVVEPKRRKDKLYRRRVLFDAIQKEMDASIDGSTCGDDGKDEVDSVHGPDGDRAPIAVTTEQKEAMDEKRERRRQKREQLEAFVVPRLHTLLDDRFVAEYPGVIENASVLIGMHPDQATEPIVEMALKHSKPFAIVPCCVFAHENPDRRTKDGGRVNTTLEFIQYLLEKSDSANTLEIARKSFLAFDGMNIVVYRNPIKTP
ncbi:hypothetical protein EMPS_01970 [Entomortierella parvispora]|uniref:C3H1-type domain-containing protein n=1 Tax=Entomortierella parvispora TaxID=205924 RepID=A0A9P3LT43_9FUNG|nr:hypothetical protein EMPS_01970 [Entomortierella parvispora]